MLIKYKNRVINLDQVTEFMKWEDNNIRFFLNLLSSQDEEQEYSNFFFDSELDRDEAFDFILESYAHESQTCDLTCHEQEKRLDR